MRAFIKASFFLNMYLMAGEHGAVQTSLDCNLRWPRRTQHKVKGNGSCSPPIIRGPRTVLSREELQQ